MRNLFILYMISLLAAAGCRSLPKEKPVWSGPQSVITVPDFRLDFKSPDKNWTARLLSFAQPVELKVEYTSTGFSVSSQNAHGITEGAAQICLQSGHQYFFYPVEIKNTARLSSKLKDYRSPKTVNPDSSLLQQRIIHRIDSFRNLVEMEGRGYFFEEEIRLAPKAGTYRAIPDEPLSAYYVQPGSASSVPLQAVYDAEKKSFHITAGPLKDVHGNIVADGTAMILHFTDGRDSWQMETSVLSGKAGAFIPAGTGKITVYARVNETRSVTLKLSAP